MTENSNKDRVDLLEDLRRTTNLHYAAMKGDAGAVSTILNCGRHTGRCDHNPNQLDGCGQTALHLAAEFGHLETCKTLLQYGADPRKACTPHQSLPMQRAANVGHYDVVKMMLDLGVDPNYQDKSGNTALISAATGGNT